MGFGFNLIGFPLLLLATGGLIIYVIAKQTWKPLLIIAGLWGVTILVFVMAMILNHYRTPIRLTKKDIVGNYRIDTNFYPGINAKWQYDHYRFTITPTGRSAPLAQNRLLAGVVVFYYLSWTITCNHSQNHFFCQPNTMILSWG